jgi:hypothetical protein
MTGSYDASPLRMWNLESGQRNRMTGEMETVKIALSPGGKKVVSGSDDGAVKLWDIDMCKVTAKWTVTKRKWCQSAGGEMVGEWWVDSRSIEIGHTEVRILLPASLCRTLLAGQRCTFLCIARRKLIEFVVQMVSSRIFLTHAPGCMCYSKYQPRCTRIIVVLLQRTLLVR